QQKQFLNTIRNNVERMAVLVSDLADLSRIESGRIKIELKEVDVAQAVQEAVKHVHSAVEAKGQSVEQRLAADLPRARTDPVRLGQVLMNLLSNANKYSPTGASIIIVADAKPPFVRITVSDTGIGIAPEDVQKLYTAFFRSDDPAVRQETGWGLGLHLSKRLVEVLGGELNARSEVGKGSTFTFTVPIDS
ncbi:MAG: sensor histidine kinase, partial [Anaerolineales bacterium]